MKSAWPTRQVQEVPFSRAWELAPEWFNRYTEEFGEECEETDQDGAMVLMVGVFGGSSQHSYKETVYVMGSITDESTSARVLYALDLVRNTVTATTLGVNVSFNFTNKALDPQFLKERCTFLPVNVGPEDPFYEESTSSQ